MARIHGISGKMQGKKGDSVFTVRNGQQIVSQYAGIKKDAKSPEQIKVRSRMKLISQIGSIMHPYFAVPKEGSQKPMGMFIKQNYPKTVNTVDGAECMLDKLEFTKGAIPISHFFAQREYRVAINLMLLLNEAKNFHSVVYLAFKVDDEGMPTYWMSIKCDDAGINGNFPAALPAYDGNVLIYCYGFYNRTERAKMVLDNIEGDAASAIAAIISKRYLSTCQVGLSLTRGLYMPQGVYQRASNGKQMFYITQESRSQMEIKGTGVYQDGDTVTLDVVPEENYQFVNFYPSVGPRINYCPWSFEIHESFSVWAQKEGKNYPPVLTVSPEGAGTVRTSGRSNYGSNIICIATQGAGYRFAGWYEDGVLVSSNKNYSYTVEKVRYLTAVFEV